MTEQNSTQKLVDIESKTIGASVPAAVVLPPGFDPEGEPLPLFIELHGLGGDRTELGRAFGRWIDEMFRAGTLCPAVLVSCSSEPGGFYAGAWERFFAEELPEWMSITRKTSARDPIAKESFSRVSRWEATAR